MLFAFYLKVKQSKAKRKAEADIFYIRSSIGIRNQEFPAY